MARTKGNNGKLVLTRKKNEVIMIGDQIQIEVVNIGYDRIKLAILAPPHIAVHRREIYDRINAEKCEIRAVNQTVRNRKRRFLNLPRNVVRLGGKK